MPRSFSRIAGRAPRTRAWCISSFGNVSSVPASMAMEPLLREPADSCTELAVYSIWKDCESHERQGTLDQEGRRQAFPVAEIPGRGSQGDDPVRARLVHGVAAHFRPAGARAAGFFGDEWFAARGFDTWCLDNEGYGRSDKSRPINCDISNGADDLDVASQYVLKNSGQKKILVYGISSGALKAALFTQRHPERVARLALDAFVWTGEGSPTLAERRKRLPEFQSKNRRPIDRAFVRSIFQRDHP